MAVTTGGPGSLQKRGQHTERCEEIPKSVQPVFPYAEQTMDLETTFRTRMQALSSPEFVNFLRPVFQEDELKLIFVGAVLGMMAGIGQLVFIFG